MFDRISAVTVNVEFMTYIQAVAVLKRLKTNNFFSIKKCVFPKAMKLA